MKVRLDIYVARLDIYVISKEKVSKYFGSIIQGNRKINDDITYRVSEMGRCHQNLETNSTE